MYVFHKLIASCSRSHTWHFTLKKHSSFIANKRREILYESHFRSTYLTQVVTLWHGNLHKPHLTRDKKWRTITLSVLWLCCCICTEDVPLVEFMYFVFTCMPSESYHRQPRSLLLCSCDIFWVLIKDIFLRLRTLCKNAIVKVFSGVIKASWLRHRESVAIIIEKEGSRSTCVS